MSFQPDSSTVTSFNQDAPLLEYMWRMEKYFSVEGATEVVINRPGEVHIKAAKGWEYHDDSDIDLQYCQHLAQLIATSTGQRIDKTSPILFASLPTNERVQVVVPPACKKNTVSLSFRVPSSFRRSFDEYAMSGYFDSVGLTGLNKGVLSDDEESLWDLYSKGDIPAFLEKAILTRQNIVVSGATDAGKTTVMKSMINLIPDWERLITLENTDEIKIWETHRNSVALFYSANNQGQHHITQHDLLRSCLRMNPTRILLAELTAGEEAMSFINSINSGHPGSITSVHANSSLAAFERLISLLGDSASGANKPDHVLRRLLHLTIDVVIQCVQIERPGSPPIYKCSDIYYDPNKKYESLTQ